MRRSKQVQVMVDNFNKYLEANRISDEYNNEVLTMCYLLQQAKCYKGYNMFYINKWGIKVNLGSFDLGDIARTKAFVQLY